MLLLLLAACAPGAECPGGAVRGIATDVNPEEGGTVSLYAWDSRELVAEIDVSGYRRFEFNGVAAGEYALRVASHYFYYAGACDCWSDNYAVTVCDGPVEVYPGEDPPADDAGECTCGD